MTKAILYGSLPEVGSRELVIGLATHMNCKQNPLHFSFPPEIDEEALMSGAQQLSEAILESG